MQLTLCIVILGSQLEKKTMKCFNLTDMSWNIEIFCWKDLNNWTAIERNSITTLVKSTSSFSTHLLKKYHVNLSSACLARSPLDLKSASISTRLPKQDRTQSIIKQKKSSVNILDSTRFLNVTETGIRWCQRNVQAKLNDVSFSIQKPGLFTFFW